MHPGHLFLQAGKSAVFDDNVTGLIGLCHTPFRTADRLPERGDPHLRLPTRVALSPWPTHPSATLGAAPGRRPGPRQGDRPGADLSTRASGFVDPDKAVVGSTGRPQLSPQRTALTDQCILEIARGGQSDCEVTGRSGSGVVIDDDGALPLVRGEYETQRAAVAVRGQVNLCRQSAAGPPEGMVVWLVGRRPAAGRCLSGRPSDVLPARAVPIGQPEAQLGRARR